MGFINHEFKAVCADPAGIRALLEERNAEYLGRDEQVDTYFNVPNGRLKLREGNIEHALIHYHREDRAGSRISHVQLYRPEPDPALKEILTAALGVRVVVAKQRDIYTEDNVKIHVDHVEGLGDFLEVEAVERSPSHTEESLRAQCDEYVTLFGVREGDFISVSYADLMQSRG
ncbi:MAG: CYTH domain-containing protein [Bacteroidota bacterium]|nr:CYTH domain-containing protein [Bacteroidota bacterium]